MPAQNAARTRRGRSAKRLQRQEAYDDVAQAVEPGLIAGRYKPLSAREMNHTHAATLELLSTLGLSQATPTMIELVCARGGTLDDAGRLLFPKALVEEALAGFKRTITLYARRSGMDLEISGLKVHTSTGGGAPSILDLYAATYRPTVTQDLYDCARVVDQMEHIHAFSRPVVCTDAPDPLALDVNTLYACLAGTNKHVCMSVSDPENMETIAELCYLAAGGEEAFRARPFVTIMCTHVVPPMRFATESCEIAEHAIRQGFPVQYISAGQMGATSPVTLAGSLVQAVAETLGGMVGGWLVDPEASIIFAPKPLVSDLRTGAMCGGGGEQAVLMAAAAQMGRYYDLPTSSIAGYTDSKVHDAQAGYEKNLSVSLAAHAGCNIITHSCGTLASMLGCSLESFVIDNDMLGGMLRSIRGVEVDASTVSIDVIADVVKGEGHYLGHEQTLSRMESDYVYPHIADRRTPSEWQEDGAEDMLTRARAKAKEILATHQPSYLPDDVDQIFRERHTILVPRAADAS
ncbi:MAG: trimethylamine methyltransferase family protein [Pseudomonadota bacterium]